MPLFEVAILQKPTKKEVEEEGKTETLVYGPKAVVARDPQGAGIAAVMSPDAPKGIDPSKCEVLVRPFV
jgi:hypothetical protein